MENDDSISLRTLKMIDSSIKNLSQGKAGDPINLEELIKCFNKIETSKLEPSRIICSECGCVIGQYHKEKVCKHLKDLLA